MKKLAWLALLYSSSLLFFLFQGGRTSIVLFVILNVLLVYLALGYWSGIRKIQGKRTLDNQEGVEHSHIFRAGQTIQANLDIKLNGWLATPYIHVEEALQRHDGVKLLFDGVITSGFRHTTKFKYTIHNIPRGEYVYLPLQCTSYDAFGLYSHKGRTDLPTNLKVLPKVLTVEQWQMLFKAYSGQLSFLSTNRYAKESNQQTGIRDYHYGDKITKIHWNATAKTGQWKSKDFERESVPKTMIVLDCYKGKATPANYIDESFELAVTTAASLFDYGLRQQSAFGMMTYSQSSFIAKPNHGQVHYSSVMNHLMTIAPSCDYRLSEVLMQLGFEQTFKGVLFIVTSEIGERMLACFNQLERRGYAPYLFYIPQQGKENVQLKLKQFQSGGYEVFDASSFLEISSMQAGGEPA